MQVTLMSFSLVLTGATDLLYMFQQYATILQDNHGSHHKYYGPHARPCVEPGGTWSRLTGYLNKFPLLTLDIN